ncbi:MAG: 1-acylglycerol-3-phosphate O-acyltransferase [Gammaproteobacteria bacterium]|nr:MAG: 1-acylglycerol-3-phosphate O-acyltransferase [Gammaproteobacteria bacterium]
MHPLRQTLVWTYFLTASLAGLIFTLFRPFHRNNSHYCARLIAWGGRRLLGLDVRHINEHYLDTTTPSVIIANHQHNYDVFVVGGIVPKRTVSVGKKILKWVPLFGQMYWLAGNVLIDRKRKRAAVATMNATEEAIRRDRKTIWVFPEGTRNKGNNLLPFKKGAFHLAVATGAPIIPVCVTGYLEALKARGADARKALIEVLAPIPTVGMTAEDVPRLMELCRQRMHETIERLEAMLHGDEGLRLAA